MLEPHPPHHTPNTWRDFFIHIGTIVVGLLIAVSLEQTVEYFHRQHLRHELFQSLEEDTAICVEDGRGQAQYLKSLAAWIVDRQQRVNAALSNGQPLGNLPSRPVRPKNLVVLSYTHFQSAKSSGALQLLPIEDLDAFSDVNFDIEASFLHHTDQRTAAMALSAFEAEFHASDSTGPDFSKATPAELKEEIRLLEDLRLKAHLERDDCDDVAGAGAAVLRGERGIRNLQQAEIEETDRDYGTKNW